MYVFYVNPAVCTINALFLEMCQSVPGFMWKQSITERCNILSLWGRKWQRHTFRLVIFCTSRWLMVFAVFAFCAPNSRSHLA